jgi:hypothetical protein
MTARVIALILSMLLTSTSAIASGEGPAFDINAYRQYERVGDAQIVGQLAVTLPDGTTAGMAGETVAAYPDGEYIRWWLGADARAHQLNVPGPDLDKDIARVARYAVTDPYGNFRIGGLPRGQFIVRGVMYVDFPLRISVMHPVITGIQNGKAVTTLQTAAAIQTVRSTVYLVSNIARVTPHYVVPVSFFIAARGNRAIGTPQLLSGQSPYFEGGTTQ